MSAMPPPPPAPEPPGGSSGSGRHRPAAGPDRLFAWLRDLGLRRNTSDRWVAGVCSGIAERFGVDPLVIRAVTLALFLFGGIGFLLYMIAWALLPARDERIKAEEALHGDAGGILLLVVIVLSLLGEVTNRHWSWVFVPIGLAVWFFVRKSQCGQGPQEIGAEAKARAEEVARTVQGWGQPKPGSSPADASTGMPPAAPHGMGPGRTWVPSAPEPPREVLVRERRRGIGFLGFVLVLGLAVLAYGVAAALEWTDRPIAFALACAVGVLGLGLLVVALVGRRAGGLATLGIAAALAAAVATTAPAMTFSNLSAGVGEKAWQPAEQEAPQAYQLGVGEARLDLGALKPEGPKEQPISASVGVGEIHVLVPAGLTVRVDATVGAGEIATRTGSRHGHLSGTQGGTGLSDSMLVGPGTTPDAVVTAEIGLGSLTIVTP